MHLQIADAKICTVQIEVFTSLPISNSPTYVFINATSVSSRPTFSLYLRPTSLGLQSSLLRNGPETIGRNTGNSHIFV